MQSQFSHSAHDDKNGSASVHIRRTAIIEVLNELQKVESLHALIAANDCHGFFSMSKPQQMDVLSIATELTLEARCLLATEIV